MDKLQLSGEGEWGRTITDQAKTPHSKKNHKIINSLLSYITVKSFSVFMIIIHLQNLLILQTKVLLQETFQKKTPNDNGMSEFKYLMVWNEWMLTYRSL